MFQKSLLYWFKITNFVMWTLGVNVSILCVLTRKMYLCGCSLKIKTDVFFLMGSQALDYILFLIKVSFYHSSIHSRLRLMLSLFITQQSLVGEALAGFFPATGGAPLILALHSIHLTALFGLTTTLPADAKTKIMRRRRDVRKQEMKGCLHPRLMWSNSIKVDETEGR